MIPTGSLVISRGQPFCPKSIGVVIDSFPPTIYENRTYEVYWQQSKRTTLEEEKDLQKVESSAAD